MTESDKLKKLREDAWGLQNRLSGRPGLGSAGESLPEDLKRGVQNLCTSAISACSDFEQGYMDPADFEERAARFGKKMSEIRILLDATEKQKLESVQAAAEARKLGRAKLQSTEAVMQQEESRPELSRSYRFDEASERLRTAKSTADLRGLGLGDGDVSGLIEVLKEGVFVGDKLDLSDNSIGDLGCQILASGLATGCCPGLREVVVSGNEFGLPGKMALMNGLQIIRKDLIIKL